MEKKEKESITRKGIHLKQKNPSQEEGENDSGSEGMITIQLDSNEIRVKRDNIKNSDERIVGSRKKGKRKKENERKRKR